MFSTLDDLLRSYRRQMGFQSGEPEPMQQSLLYYLLACSTITGLGFICWRLSQFIRLLLSLFILPGKSVSVAAASQHPPLPFLPRSTTCNL